VFCVILIVSKGKMTTMKTTVTLVAVFAVFNTIAMAQSEGDSFGGMTASSATRSAMNSMYGKHDHHHGWSASRYNGRGINSLGITTNQGRKYNGG
jgi:hypothetical protein